MRFGVLLFLASGLVGSCREITAPEPTAVTWSYCTGSALASRYPTPTWMAFKDGDADWARVTPTGSTFSFTLNSERGGVAYLSVSGSGRTSLTVIYASAAELSAGPAPCEQPLGTKNVSGTAINFGASDRVNIRLGLSSVSVTGTSPKGYLLSNVASTDADLIAVRTLQVATTTSTTVTPLSVIMRRAQNPVAGTALSELDLTPGGVEAFAPVSHTATMTGTSPVACPGQGNLAFIGNRFYAGGTATDLSAYVAETASSATFAAIPTSRLATSDLNFIEVYEARELCSASTGYDERYVETYFRADADKTIALGPALGPLTIADVSGLPFARTSARYTVQPEYANQWIFGVSQNVVTSSRSVTVVQTRGYGETSVVTLVVPDLTAVPGWQNVWGLQRGATATAQWFFVATSDLDLFVSLPRTRSAKDGLTTKTGTRHIDVFTP